MNSPWLSVPLEEYESHMRSAGVQQLLVLADLFKYVLERNMPESVAVLGVAGGNGLKHIDPAITKRTVGVDINQAYLEVVKQRFDTVTEIELHCCDLRISDLRLSPVSLVHAALVFEHTGLDRSLDNALSLVAPGGTFSVVLQLPSTSEQAVAAIGYPSMQSLKQDFKLVSVDQFQRLLVAKQFTLIEQERRPVPSKKAFWFGLFSRNRRREEVAGTFTHLAHR